ncbi:hypothetical protein H6P81_007874 [Aristolochia fimbriata]|uniref:Uncharacterized protein n=1 Tax=Aristolochia fimbriata TaxID=158543 RepID=A0AAV7F1G3_ARIFI|nr:hypothetical protein H6P81_007874 [Aristolochia fimbriata]
MLGFGILSSASFYEMNSPRDLNAESFVSPRPFRITLFYQAQALKSSGKQVVAWLIRRSSRQTSIAPVGFIYQLL